MTTSPTDSAAFGAVAPVQSPKPGIDRRLISVLVALVVVIALVIAGLVIGGVGPFSRASTSWSAVFLSDNEVYFGHISAMSDDDIRLKNVAYLQKSQSTQAGAAAASAQQAPSQLSILGLVANQIQCPKDEVVINRHNVINVQELQSSSFVVSRLETLAKTTQNCFQPATASPTPAPAGGAPASPSTSPRQTP